MSTHPTQHVTPIGVDFGGSGIKAAPVDVTTGAFAADRVRIPTPEPATPGAVADVVAELIDQVATTAEAPVGVTVPGVVMHGVVRSAANIDRGWLGVDADALFTSRLGRDVRVLNDADAAGLAEVHHGAARGRSGLVVVTTLGTGIGSALVYDGTLVPNSELGHLELHGRDAEHWAADSARKRHELSWVHWAKRLTTYYRTLERLFSPDLFVVGGGVSKHAAEFLPLVEVDTELVPAALRNTAGIVGAALVAADRVPHPGQPG